MSKEKRLLLMKDLYQLIVNGKTICTSSNLNLMLNQLCINACSVPECNSMIVSQITGEIIVDYDPREKSLDKVWHFSKNIKYVI